ncbi:MAG: putative ABC transporter permease [bacterium]
MLILKILVTFLIISIMGWLLDTIWRSVRQKQFAPGNYLKPLPVCPIYGFGGLLIMTIAPVVIELPVIAQALILMIALSSLELGGSIFTRGLLKKTLWDYSGNRLNIKGHTDLGHAIAWGILGLAFLHFVHPMVAGLLSF